MPPLPHGLSQAEIIRALVNAGGTELAASRGKGSHRVVRMPDVARPVVVPVRIKDGLVRGIIKQAGLTVDEFVENL